MKTILNPQKKDWNKILERPTKTVDDIENIVDEVFTDVQKNGDAAVAKYTQKFDSVSLESNAVSESEISCLLYTSPSPRDLSTSRMPSSA